MYLEGAWAGEKCGDGESPSTKICCFFVQIGWKRFPHSPFFPTFSPPHPSGGKLTLPLLMA